MLDHSTYFAPEKLGLVVGFAVAADWVNWLAESSEVWTTRMVRSLCSVDL